MEVQRVSYWSHGLIVVEGLSSLYSCHNLLTKLVEHHKLA
jgi:hypothetical protein